MIDAGKLRVFVGAAFPLQEASQAYAHKPLRGKNVLVVDR
jgi:NADPH:quinone reductase-like Zn-dependent oxidoreductase